MRSKGICHDRHANSPERRRLLLRLVPVGRPADQGALHQPVLRRRRRQIKAEEVPADDDVAQFIAQIERSDKAFQRAALARRRSRSIRNFYETAITQPPIPGDGPAVHAAEAAFRRRRTTAAASASLQEPEEKFLIIDGQHRLAALQFYERTHPDDAKNIQVPCVIFDGRSEDFATEMFVIINSTPTRINKSHLVDLYERVSWAEPDRRFAAHIVEMLYSEGGQPAALPDQSPGRSQQAGEMDSAGGAVQRDPSLGETGVEEDRKRRHGQARRANAITRWCAISSKPPRRSGAKRGATTVTWSPSRSRSKPCCASAPISPRQDAEPAEGRVERWRERLAPWTEQAREFPQRRLLRALPGQRPGRARRAHPSRTRALRRHRAAQKVATVNQNESLRRTRPDGVRRDLDGVAAAVL